MLIGNLHNPDYVLTDFALSIMTEHQEKISSRHCLLEWQNGLAQVRFPAIPARCCLYLDYRRLAYAKSTRRSFFSSFSFLLFWLSFFSFSSKSFSATLISFKKDSSILSRLVTHLLASSKLLLSCFTTFLLFMEPV